MNKRPRVSQDQREMLLQFMMGHADLGRGRVAGADAARRKETLLKELACQLTALGSGATKSPEKWWKCWQDWRCDTKAKSLRLKKYSAGTGGGPSPAPLTKLEETLLQFCGIEMVLGNVGVLDPLEHTEPIIEVQETHFEAQEAPHASASQSAPCVPEVTPPKDVPTAVESRSSRKNSLEKSLERQAAALERLAIGMENMATAIHSGLMALATAIENTRPQEFVSVPEENN